MEEWKKGEKHPDTPVSIFRHVYERDRMRRILTARCASCGATVSMDEREVRQITAECDDKNCTCHKKYSSQIHQVCQVCYDMYHAIYFNNQLKNTNYWKDLDEAEARALADRRRRTGTGDKDGFFNP